MVNDLPNELTARFDEFETIDWLEESKKEREKRKEVYSSTVDTVKSLLTSVYETVQVWVVISLVGCVIGLNTGIISIVTEWLSDIKLGYCSKYWWLNEKFCCWQSWDKYGSCPDWKEWSHLFAGKDIYYLNWISYIFISALAVASGISVGKEGPAVHMGCCVGNVVSQNFGKYKNNKIKHREILSASAAAGIAVAFGSPVGGVLFSMEDISYTFPLQTLSRSFFCALIATTVIHTLNPFRTGKLGLCGAILTNLNLKVARIDMGKLLSYLFQECEDGNWAGLCQPENNFSMVVLLLLATVVRFFGTGFAYGCKVPCGIFVPGMAIGATFGRMLGILVQSLHRSYPNSSFFSQCSPDVPCITPATYAFLGAAAGLGGVTRVTVAVVVIMYELTGAVSFIVPTIIVVMISKFIADFVSPGAISEQLIELNGLPYVERNSTPLNMLISSIMKSDIFALTLNTTTIEELRDTVLTYPYGVFPIVNDKSEMKLEGITTRKKLLKLLKESDIPSQINLDSYEDLDTDSIANNFNRFPPSHGDHPQSNINFVSFSKSRSDFGYNVYDFSDAVDFTPIVVDCNSSTETVSEIFETLGPKVVLIQNNRGKLVGLISRKDMIREKIIRHSHH
ncbi:H(+)/Cl(-) exchange transporter 5 [Smittium culicis]|uniref:Chloride channel protein n=1 Tax=Smittium culicis TaxID=133412 RepID=A0A1R1WY10_9FUNG|nr:H(+)/Cl(-) exchange transporter 5 [Smittium culicis]